jgi:AraC-like DNA-binding protein
LLAAQAQLHLPAELLGFRDAVICDRRLWVALEQYHSALQAGDFTIVRECRMYAVLRVLLREHAGELSTERTHNGWQEAKKMRAMLHSCRDSSPTIKELANYVNLNPFQTIRIFRETFGVTPHAYLLSLKVSRAKDLLRSGTTISEVAMELGFVDQSHLHRNFKKMTGATPGEYRKALNATCGGVTRDASSR